jgi:hypothetical protein
MKCFLLLLSVFRHGGESNRRGRQGVVKA